MQETHDIGRCYWLSSFVGHTKLKMSSLYLLCIPKFLAKAYLIWVFIGVYWFLPCTLLCHWCLSCVNFPCEHINIRILLLDLFEITYLSRQRPTSRPSAFFSAYNGYSSLKHLHLGKFYVWLFYIWQFYWKYKWLVSCFFVFYQKCIHLLIYIEIKWL